MLSGDVERGKIAVSNAYLITRSNQLSQSGPVSVVGRDLSGATLFEAAIGYEKVEDLRSPGKPFFGCVPLSPVSAERIASLTFKHDSDSVTINSTRAGRKPDAIFKRSGKSVDIRWDSRHFPTLRIYTDSGELLALLAGGHDRFVSPTNDIRVEFSYRVSSMSRHYTLP